MIKYLKIVLIYKKYNKINKTLKKENTKCKKIKKENVFCLVSVAHVKKILKRANKIQKKKNNKIDLNFQIYI